MIKPAESIIPRTLEKELSGLLNNFSLKIEETVNLGSKILLWDIQNEKNKGGFEGLPIILFFRNYLEQLDASSILIKYSSVEPVNNLLRTALENFFYIEYLLEKDFKKRSLSFLVWTTFRTISYYEKADGKSQSYKELLDAYKQDKIVSNSCPIIIPNIEELKKNSVEFLNQVDYKEVTKEYRNRLGKRKRIEWYSLFGGPENIKELSKYLKYPAFYNIIYQSLSSSIHGTNTIQGKITSGKNNNANIYQIRLPLDIEFLVNLCITLSFHLYHDFTIKRLPERVDEVRNWYLSLKPFLDSLKTKQIAINYSS
jgi:hypothetical protein